MKTDPNDTAYPIVVTKDRETEIGQGLTKREYFAAMAMQGFCANANVFSNLKDTAIWAVKEADALINELNKTPTT